MWRLLKEQKLKIICLACAWFNVLKTTIKEFFLVRQKKKQLNADCATTYETGREYSVWTLVLLMKFECHRKWCASYYRVGNGLQSIKQIAKMHHFKRSIWFIWNGFFRFLVSRLLNISFVHAKYFGFVNMKHLSIDCVWSPDSFAGTYFRVNHFLDFFLFFGFGRPRVVVIELFHPEFEIRSDTMAPKNEEVKNGPQISPPFPTHSLIVEWFLSLLQCGFRQTI